MVLNPMQNEWIAWNMQKQWLCKWI
jgi:hypothetical protein